MSGNKYLDEFFSFRAAGEILAACGPINNGAKEITEAMAIRHRLRNLLLYKKTEYTVIDLCSGNALIPALTAFTLPVKECIAIDKKRHKRNWHLIKKFSYHEINIYTQEILSLVKRKSPCIITSCHACGNLSKRVIEIFREGEARQLIMMPCCIGSFEKNYSQFLQKKLGKSGLWAFHMSELAEGSIEEDKGVLSPRNKIITSVRRVSAD